MDLFPIMFRVLCLAGFWYLCWYHLDTLWMELVGLFSRDVVEFFHPDVVVSAGYIMKGLFVLYISYSVICDKKIE